MFKLKARLAPRDITGKGSDSSRGYCSAACEKEMHHVEAGGEGTISFGTIEPAYRHNSLDPKGG